MSAKQAAQRAQKAAEILLLTSRFDFECAFKHA